MRSKLNEYPRTPGEQICRNHFASSFSIVVKFRAHSNIRFTLLNVSDENGDEFSIVIDMIGSSVILRFGDCTIHQLELPFGTDNGINVGQWHRLGVAVDPEFIVLFKDCENVHIQRYNNSDCRVVCDESVEFGVLEAEYNVMLLSLLSLTLFKC